MLDFPRRSCIAEYSSGELAISQAVGVVETMGADIRLTNAIVLLGKAKDEVANFVDGVESSVTQCDVVKKDEIPPKLLRESVRLVLEQEKQIPSPAPGYIFISIDYNQINKLVGRLKTIADAIGLAAEQNKAVKDLLLKEVWNWVNNSFNQTPQKIKDVKAIESAPSELIEITN
jgi:hypothetical protein